ncbi:squalene/phytoene synthase family protein [Streptomyces sp. NPDC005900]|uniref:squalene/phytoene synthase family protein n=1 Tax=Streptomyces sp. NPDC005900 TaxID=3154569 RepID=UPI00340A0E14
MTVLDEAHTVVRSYSTTWYDPVVSMPPRLNEATTAAYLCMRAIDEIEDHPALEGTVKATLLRDVSKLWQSRFTEGDFTALLSSHDQLPEVTCRLGEWTALAPPDIAPRVLETFATMAARMADWAETDFAIHTEQDLNRYTYAVAGTLVLLLSDLWAWHDGTRTHRTHAIAYGRALQAVNILIDRDTDTTRGVDFWPDHWQRADLAAYCRAELAQADLYLAALPSGPARVFCERPLSMAHHALGRASRSAASRQGGRV